MKILTTHQIHEVSGAININPSIDDHVMNLAKGAFLGHLGYAFLSMVSVTKPSNQGTLVFLGAALYELSHIGYDIYSSYQTTPQT